MRVKLKLYASLAEYLPAEQRGNEVEVEVAASDHIDAVLERYRVPRRLAHLVLVNGAFIPPAERQSHCLAEGDHLAVWPPIAGG